MSKRILAILGVVLAVVSAQAQTARSMRQPIAKKSVSPNSAPAKVGEISEVEWAELTKTLDAENWNKAAILAQAGLKKLKSENEKKQLARLRYFYLHALAAKVALKSMLLSEFETVSQAFIGQEFLTPAREILADCSDKVNYICPVKSDEQSLRVTATNKNASAINAFEYMKLAEKLDFGSNDGKRAFIRGKLKKIEVGSYKNDMKIAKLYFEEGAVDILKPE